MNTNKRHQGNFNNIISSVAADAPVVEIKSFALAGAGLARVTVDVTHTAKSRADHALVAATIEHKLQDRMTAVAGSFAVLDKGNFTDRITGLVSVKREAMPATEDNLKGFRATASNMFMDDESEMWVLRKTEAGGLLVKTTGIDDDMTLVHLLESNSSAGFRNSSGYNTAVASAADLAQSVAGGMFVSYVNVDNMVAHGFVVATAADSDDVVVLPVVGDVEEVVKRAAITEVHAQDEFPQVEATKEEQVEEVVAAARGEIDLAFLLEFYKKVYARSPQFFSMFAQRANAHQFY